MPTNYALASNGSTAAASSTNGGWVASKAIDGFRYVSGFDQAWQSGNVGPSVGSPETLEVDFGTSRTIGEIDVFFNRSSGFSTTPPTLSETGTANSATDFKLQYWNGSAWVDIAGTSVTGNTNVWRQFTFTAITCTKIRLYVTAADGGGRAGCAELEAWSVDVPVNITTTSLPGGTVGVAYDWTGLLNATGGTGSLTWTIVGGSLPTGFGTLPTSGSGSAGTPTAAGTYNFTVRATDSLGAFDDQALSIVISNPAVAPSNKWTLARVVPMANMIAWHMHDPAAGLSANNLVSDFSGHNRHLTCGAGNAPVIQSNLLNGNAGWYFSGTKDGLSCAGGVTTRHLFILASYEDAAFPADYKGLYSNPGMNSGDILIGFPSSDRFAYFGSPTYEYRKSEVVFVSSDQKAPLSGQHALIEVISSTGFAADGIKIGQQQGLDRRWKGWYFESLAYSQVQADVERRMIYEYFAMKYFVWSKTAAGKDVWPFQPNWTVPGITDKRILESRAVSGAYKGRQKGTMKGGKELKFETRITPEHDAAKAFWNAKHPGTSFIYRDYAYVPSRDSEVQFIGGIPHQFNNYNDIDYAIQIEDV